MNVLLYDIYGDHIRDWLMGLVDYLRERGHSVAPASQKGPGKRDAAGFRQLLDGIDHLFLWNGNLEHYKPLRRLARERNISVTIVEVGWFPQRKWYHLDHLGINAKSSLMTDDLAWIGDEHLERLRGFAGEYLQGRRWSGGGEYVLCPLQLEEDTNIQEHSPFKNMQAFIDHVERVMFPAETVLFKAHPVAAQRQYRTRTPIVRGGDFLRMAQDARRVVGINSTCLLEAVMMGVPTTALGDGFLTAHQGREHKLLAALVDRQIPVGSTDVRRWVEPYLTGSGSCTRSPAIE